MTGDTIDFLMSQKDGANYVVLYQMLCLMVANTNGSLCKQVGEVLIPYDIDRIKRDCKYFDRDTVIVAMELFKKLGLVYESDEGIMQITHFNDMVGSTSDYAEQKRNQRLGVDNVHSMSTKMSIQSKSIDIDIDKELDKDIDINNNNIYSRAISEIVDYLNKKTGKSFRSSSAETKKLIIGLLKQNYTVDDFKKVIDIKTDKWLKDEKMVDYLRPKTLFSNKFESYLNEKPIKHEEEKKDENGIPEDISRRIAQLKKQGYTDEQLKLVADFKPYLS